MSNHDHHDRLIGPGPTNYGEYCQRCMTGNHKHRSTCPRVVERCGKNKHNECEKDGCNCYCHPALTNKERFELRRLLTGRALLDGMRKRR